MSPGSTAAAESRTYSRAFGLADLEPFASVEGAASSCQRFGRCAWRSNMRNICRRSATPWKTLRIGWRRGSWWAPSASSGGSAAHPLDSPSSSALPDPSPRPHRGPGGSRAGAAGRSLTLDAVGGHAAGPLLLRPLPFSPLTFACRASFQSSAGWRQPVPVGPGRFRDVPQTARRRPRPGCWRPSPRRAGASGTRREHPEGRLRSRGDQPPPVLR